MISLFSIQTINNVKIMGAIIFRLAK